MKIEFLYFEDCPNYKKAYKLLLQVLQEEKITAQINRIEIKNNKEAQKHKFIGSPTIRINGRDIDDSVKETKNYAQMCRVYNIGGKLAGIPTVKMIRKAVNSN